MPELIVAGRTIPYEIRRSKRAKRLRIVVRRGRVEVVAPQRMWRARIEAFVRAQRRWIDEKTRSQGKPAPRMLPERFVDGERVLYRDRWLRLAVGEAPVKRPKLRFADRFDVQVPAGMAPGDQERAVERLVLNWLKQRAREEAEELVERYGPRLGRRPARLRIGRQKTLWGSCSAKGTISLNVNLMAGPQPVFEYVVVHEFCHLVHRNHSARFWALVGSLLPGYEEHRRWLRERGVALE